MGTENFLANLNPRKRLCDIVLPGSHDAGIAREHYSGMGFIGNHTDSSKVITQDKNIFDQAIAGSRFFDIRLKFDKKSDSYSSFHAPGMLTSQGGTGLDMDDILEQLLKFVQTNSSEFVIARLSHLKDPGLDSAHSVLRKLKKWIGENENFVCKLEGNLAVRRIEELKQKIIFVVQGAALDGTNFGQLQGMHRLYQNKGGADLRKAEDGLCFCGEFSKSNSLGKIIDGQLKNFSIHAGHLNMPDSHAHMSCLYWTSTYGDIKIHTEKLHSNYDFVEALVTNMEFNEEFKFAGEKYGDKFKTEIVRKVNEARRQFAITGYSPPNIIIYDFVNEYLSSKIIELNDYSF
ncbi:hypothetical protein ACHEXK_10080 [Limnohabitans sp. DCL3]|uniref:hypothetical protein n=1 Tax=Limnohabitans sp. DCL3 TaxID=3374103 RepID=UPI003A893BAA